MYRIHHLGRSIVIGVLGLLLFMPVAHAGDPLQEAQALFASHKTVQLKAVGSSWILTGEAGNLKEYWQIRALAYALRDAGYKVGNSVLLSDAGYSKLVIALSDAIANGDVLIRRVGESVFIEGNAPSEFEADKNINIVRMMLSPPTALGARDLGSTKEPQLLMTIIDMQKIQKRK